MSEPLVTLDRLRVRLFDKNVVLILDEIVGKPYRSQESFIQLSGIESSLQLRFLQWSIKLITCRNIFISLLLRLQLIESEPPPTLLDPIRVGVRFNASSSSSLALLMALVRAVYAPGFFGWPSNPSGWKRRTNCRHILLISDVSSLFRSFVGNSYSWKKN